MDYFHTVDDTCIVGTSRRLQNISHLDIGGLHGMLGGGVIDMNQVRPGQFQSTPMANLDSVKRSLDFSVQVQETIHR